MSILFDDIVFGPVKSRRFGVSLGINLLPVNFKFCTFNCIYCECGWTKHKMNEKVNLPEREEVFNALKLRLAELKQQNIAPDNITFAGNGEPTIHPQFSEIIDDTILLRNIYFPDTRITVLSNSSLIHKKSVFQALNKIDNNVLKLDSAIEETFMRLNQPAPGISLHSIIENLKKFDGNQIIQTLFVRGQYNDNVIDNTTREETDAWLSAICEIRPQYVMIYPVDRHTPAQGLEKISRPELEKIAQKVMAAGIKTKVYD